MNYTKLIQEAITKGRQSGQPISKVFIKEEFLKQFPQAEKDPRFTELLPEVFRMNFAIHETLAAGDLRELCAAKPDHPLSVLKRSHLLGLADNQIITVLRDDLDILRQGVTPTTEVVEPPTPSPTEPPVNNEVSTEPKKTVVPAEGLIKKAVDQTNPES